MNISLFNTLHWIRRFDEQREVKGYLTASFDDYVVSINVHPVGSDTLQALPEGERTIKRLEGHGDYPLIVADSSANTKGDLLLYEGRWYECVSSQRWNHTILSHFNYQFVLVPLDGSRIDDVNDTPVDTEEAKKAGAPL